MFKNLVFSLTLLGIFFNSLIVEAQQTKQVARIKYTLSDYKNPSSFKGRYGLTRFSPDDKLLAVGGDGKKIIIFESETGKALQKIDYGGTTNAFSFGADKKSILLQDALFTKIDVWDLETGKVRHKIMGRSGVSGLKNLLLNGVAQKHRGLEMSELPISPDGKNILVGKSDSLYQIADLTTGETRFNLEQTSKTSETKDLLKILFIPGAATTPLFFHVSNAAYNADGKRIVLANGDKVPTLWDAETGKLVAKLEPQLGKVYQVSFSTDGKLSTTTDVAGVTKIWDAETGASVSTIGTNDKKEFVVAWNPKTEMLTTYSSDEEIHFYEPRSGKLLINLGKAKVRDFLFSPDGNLIATIAKDDKNKLGQIWNAGDGKLVATLPKQPKEEHPLSIEWSANGKLLVVSSEDYVKIYNQNGEFLQSLENAVFPARFSRDAKLLATGGKNDVGYVWQINQN